MPFVYGNPFMQGGTGGGGGYPSMQGSTGMTSQFMGNPLAMMGAQGVGSSDFFAGLFNQLGQQQQSEPPFWWDFYQNTIWPEQMGAMQQQQQTPFWWDFYQNTVWPQQLEAMGRQQEMPPWWDFYQTEVWPWWKDTYGGREEEEWPASGAVLGLAGGELDYYFDPDTYEFRYLGGGSTGMYWDPGTSQMLYTVNDRPTRYWYDPGINQLSLTDKALLENMAITGNASRGSCPPAMLCIPDQI